MNFRETLKRIDVDFQKVCAEHRETYFRLGKFNVDMDVYALLKNLYDEDKDIRIKDSYNSDHVESCLNDLKRKAKTTNIQPEAQVFLQRFIAHIDYNLSLIQLMKQLESIERIGHSVEDRILFLLDFCIIIERTSYFQGLFISRLNELNAEVLGVNTADYNLFYRIGALNFKRHLYPEAIASLKQAINIMEENAPSFYATSSLAAQAEFRKTLFKIKMLMAVSFEFQGEFMTALALLVGDENTSIFRTIDMDKLIYSLGVTISSKADSSLDVIVSPKQESVIFNVQSEIIDKLRLDLAHGSCFAIAHETDLWFASLNKNQKRSLRFLEGGNNSEYLENEKKKYDQRYLYFENENVHEVLHILAHTLNEYGVAERSRSLLSGETNSDAGMLLISARALMLFAAKNQRYMVDCQKCLSCLATIFAEVGDFESAKAQLLENVKGNYYSNKDLLVQAEIEFFYYLVSLMNSPNSPDSLREQFYDKYLKCCYNHFDYDALTQIEMYRFKYSVAKAILAGASEYGQRNTTIAELKNCQNNYTNFIASLQSVFVSDWTKNEHDKINIMFQFMEKYYSIGEQNDSLSLIDLAKKYLYLYSKSIKFQDALPVSLLSLNSVEALVDFLDKVFHQPVSASYHNEKQIKIRNCVFQNLSSISETEVTNCINTAINDGDSIYFITVPLGYSAKRRPHIWTDSSEEKTLQHFIIHCAFDSILFDFVNPQNIFILVPFVNAEPLKYQLDSFDNLIVEIEGTKEGSAELKITQGEKVVRVFRKNYSSGNTNQWTKCIFEKFSSVEMILWNDEDLDSIYSRERYYMQDREHDKPRCYPLMNYPTFMITLDDIINEDGRSPIHDHCINDYECCQRVISWNDGSAVKLNSFFCLPSFRTEQLYNRVIIVKYNNRKRQWRLVVVKKPISDDDLLFLQAYICDNSDCIRYLSETVTLHPEPPPIVDRTNKLDAMRETTRLKCDDLYSEKAEWFKNRIKHLVRDSDTDARRCYEQGLNDLYVLVANMKVLIPKAESLDDLSTIVRQLTESIESLCRNTEATIISLNKGVDPK